MDSPAIRRVSATLRTPNGYIVPSGLRAFKDKVNGPDAANAFNQWRSSPYTKAMYLALQDMILHAGTTSPDEVPVQFGVTQGLALAAQLISDPSVLWPGVFGKGMVADGGASPDEPPASFSAPPDGE